MLSGKGKVSRNGKKVGEVLPGDFFGELSALDGGPRTATIAAETPMRVLRLFRHTLVSLLRDEARLTLKLLDGSCAGSARSSAGTWVASPRAASSTSARVAGSSARSPASAFWRM